MLSLVAAKLPHAFTPDYYVERVIEPEKLPKFRSVILFVEIAPQPGVLDNSARDAVIWVIGFGRLAGDDFESPVVLTRIKYDTKASHTWVSNVAALFDKFGCTYVVPMSDELGIALRLAGVSRVLSPISFLHEVTWDTKERGR